MLDRPTWLAVFAGGALGGLARWGLADWLGAGAEKGAWPWGTLIANVTGTFVLGLVATTLLVSPSDRRELVGTVLGPGLCGALTTFSALQIEVVRLVRDGHALTGVAYLALTLGLGLAAIRLGVVSARLRSP